ncbi:MAG: dihydrodipicolinate synthase family protein, partial [Planctomyces sp.]
MPRKLQGVLPIVQTPFTAADEIDVPVLRREIDWAFELGADGLGSGMVSETFRLTFSERLRLTELMAELAG